MTQIREVSIGQLLPHIRAKADNRAIQSGRTIRLVPCGAWVTSDAVWLEQAVRRGVETALTHSCGRRVVMGCRRHGNWLAIEVWSAGGGAALAWQRDMGTERSDGRPDHPILAEETVGGASRFAVLAPLSAPPPPRPATEAVVVIEDDESVLNGFRLLLETWQFDVVAAASAGDAIAMLNRRRSQPAAIVADFHLKDGSDGMGAVSRLRGLFGTSIPAILLTADPAATRASASRTGNLAVVEKPVTVAHLRRLLARLLTGR